MKDDLLPTMTIINNALPLPPSSSSSSSPSSHGLQRLMTYLIFFISITYIIYTLKLVYSHPCPSTYLSSLHLLPFHPETHETILPRIAIAATNSTTNTATTANVVTNATFRAEPTSLHHIVFGIAASSQLWDKRKGYIKLWWRPRQMRGAVWLDRPVKTQTSEDSFLPPIKISGDTSAFRYTNRRGRRSAIRISRIVTETLRLGLSDVRWFVMGDDDTVFLPENLLTVLSHYDHREFYYIGSQSESHLQNIHLSYNMAYGGGGFAISFPLAAALANMQDGCIHRYPGLYGGDDRMQACMAELGVPLTRHPGFHQYDVYGNLFGLLAAHPVVPLVSLHHLDVVAPVFPDETKAGALGRIFNGPVRLDSAAVMQQSICYDKQRRWTVSVSWGFVVQIIAGVLSPREMEMPTRTFLDWYKRADYMAYEFSTRPVAKSPCQRPFVFYLQSARFERGRNRTVTRYGPRKLLVGGGSNGKCRWKKTDPTGIYRVVVYKRTDPTLWNRSPRRSCCRILKSEDKGQMGKKTTMTIDVGVCRDGEISEI